MKRSLVVALALLAACSGDDPDPRAGSEELDDEVTIAIDEVPDAYRVTYRVLDEGGEISTEVLTVSRPFDSRLEIYDGDDADGEPRSVAIATFGRARSEGAGSPVVLAVPPGVASYDVRLDAVVEDALDAGLLVEREQRRVLDRPCQVYRTGQSLRLGELTPPGEDAFVDVCVDGDGLVLEEVDGERRRLAVEVDVDPELSDSTFDVGERGVPINRGGGAVRDLTDDSRTPGTFLELGEGLPLDHLGRYAVVPPQPDAFTDPMQRDRRVASLTDVLADGADTAIIDRGGSLGGIDVTVERELGEPIELGALGTGEVVLTSLGPEITIDLGGGSFLRLSGTLPADELAAIARDLHEVPGGELTPVGEPW